MALWRARRTVYKVGVVVQHVGFLLFVVGFSTPFWFHASPGEGSQGLWQYCNGHCHKLQVEEEWFEGVRALLCLTLIIYLVACVLAVYGNCLKKYDPLTYTLSRRIEITTAAAGLAGASGMCIYTILMKLHYQEYQHNSFGPSYGLTMASCVLALLAAVILSATANPLIQKYITLTPSGRTEAVTYQSTSRDLPPPPVSGMGGTSTAPMWNPTLSQPAAYYGRQTPSYMSGYPSAASSYGYPTEFRNASSTGYPPLYPAMYPLASQEPGVSARPPPYAVPTAPSASTSFLEAWEGEGSRGGGTGVGVY